MAQPKLEKILKNVAKNIADENLTTPFSDGRLVTGERRLQAVNEARGTVFNEYVALFQDPVKFADAYPDYLSVATKTLNPLPADVFFALKLNGNPTIERVPRDLYYESKTNTHSSFYSEPGALRFSQHDGKIEVINDDGGLTSCEMLYIKRPTDATEGGADIFESELWIDRISEVASNIIFRGLQKQNSQK